jgi:proline utilization trans-activator
MSNAQHGHLPRVNFPSDEHLLALSDAECSWPTPARAHLLVRAAVNGIGRCYHIIRRSSISQELERAIQNHSQTGLLSKSKLWAVFAIGEIYTTRHSTLERGFPGLHYFCKAMNILRIVSERPSVDMVEIQLLLVCSSSLYVARLTDPLPSLYTRSSSTDDMLRTVWLAPLCD